MSKVRITPVRSNIGQTVKHEGTLRALGLATADDDEAERGLLCEGEDGGFE